MPKEPKNRCFKRNVLKGMEFHGTTVNVYEKRERCIPRKSWRHAGRGPRLDGEETEGRANAGFPF